MKRTIILNTIVAVCFIAGIITAPFVGAEEMIYVTVVSSTQLPQNCRTIQPENGGMKQVLGTLAGAAGGAWLGSKVGGGTGNTIATVAGGVGGGMLGRELTKDSAHQECDPPRYSTTVELNGQRSTVTTSRQMTPGTRIPFRIDVN